VVVGPNHTCAIDTRGDLRCWGRNSVGHLGLGDQIGRGAPTLVEGSGWRQIDLAVAHTCGVRDDDTLWCWGSRGLNRIGDGTDAAAAAPRLTPFQVGADKDWAEVTVGQTFGCARTTTNEVWCWGGNRYGQAGGADMGSIFDFETALNQIGTDADWSQLSAGLQHTCGLRDGGRVFCWGDNDSRQLGSSSVETPTPVEVQGLPTTALEVGSGSTHTCAVLVGGAVWCWGGNVFGQLGRGVGGDNLPGPIDSAATFAHVRLGDATTCVVDDEGAALCFGFGEDGQRLDGSVERSLRAPTDGGPPERWTSLSLGEEHSCGVDDTSALLCAGNNFYGEVGLGAPGFKLENLLPRVVATGASAPLGTGAQHGCVDLGGLHCWGNGIEGRIGDGTEISRAAPVPIASGAWRSVDGDFHMTCAIDDNGDMSCWGTNPYGLGVTGVGSSYTPLAVGEAGAWRQVVVGNRVACALRDDDGSAWCWGYNSAGILAAFRDDAGTPYDVSQEPIAVSGGHSFVDLALWDAHACAIDDNGDAWCWGNNTRGRLGNGTTDFAPVPTPVTTPVLDGGTATWSDLDVGSGFSCGVRADETLWCWGSNSQGQLGNGEMGPSAWKDVPQQIGTDRAWRAVDLGQSHACALDDTGQAWCWGNNDEGQAGAGTSAMYIVSPLETVTALRFDSISCGQFYTCGLTSGGDLACWGSNDLGRLADGTALSVELVDVPLVP
jgi:alpha-tubulin suppressor-like RCC1 family protein